MTISVVRNKLILDTYFFMGIKKICGRWLGNASPHVTASPCRSNPSRSNLDEKYGAVARGRAQFGCAREIAWGLLHPCSALTNQLLLHAMAVRALVSSFPPFFNCSPSSHGTPAFHTTFCSARFLARPSQISNHLVKNGESPVNFKLVRAHCLCHGYHLSWFPAVEVNQLRIDCVCARGLICESIGAGYRC